MEAREAFKKAWGSVRYLRHLKRADTIAVNLTHAIRRWESAGKPDDVGGHTAALGRYTHAAMWAWLDRYDGEWQSVRRAARTWVRRKLRKSL